MKVILLQDVAKIGRKGMVVEVPDGYALNQLVPKRQANPATPDNLKMALREVENKKAAVAGKEERYFKLKSDLDGKTVVIKAPHNQGGHLFAAVQKGQVVEAIRALGVAVDPEMVEVPKSLKESGEHEGQLICGKHRSAFIIKIE